MNDKIHKNSSITFWIISFIVLLIPVLNVAMVIYWAFFGHDETRKNYFKALILVSIIPIAAMLAIIILSYRGADIPFIDMNSYKPK